MIFVTPDNAEWTFLQTFPDSENIEKFLRENNCKSWALNNKTWLRKRVSCYRKVSHNCPFMLLAIKTTKKRYHLYKHREHNHDAVKPKCK
jgi:hypothetical protein